MQLRAGMRNFLVDWLPRMAPFLGGATFIGCAWLVALGPFGLLFSSIGILAIPFLAIFTMLFLNVMLGMDFGSEAESKDDLDHLLQRKRTTGFPTRSRFRRVRRFARPADDLIDGLFRR